MVKQLSKKILSVILEIRINYTTKIESFYAWIIGLLWMERCPRIIGFLCRENLLFMDCLIVVDSNALYA